MRYQSAVGDDTTGPAALKLAGLTGGGGANAGWGALDGLTLAPEPGKLTVLLGPAGAGKSAVARAVAGFARVAGAITLDGRDIGRVPAWRRGFGVVLQPDALLPHLSLAGNVGFGLRMRGVRRAARGALVEAALELVQLGGLGGLRAGAASPAQRQRAMVARASVFGPRVLLLDEPACLQDPQERVALLGGVRRIHELLGGTTTLVATACGADALALGDSVAVLRAGAVEQEGTPEEVFERPRTAYVAGLLGETNRLAGVILDVDDDLATVRLLCGPVVEVLRGAGLQAGDGCVVCLRPDRVAVAAVSAAELGGHAVDATLVEARFTGEGYRLRLLIGSGAEMVVRRPAAAGLRGLAVGGAAAVAWQPQHAFAFRTGKAGDGAGG